MRTVRQPTFLSPDFHGCYSKPLRVRTPVVSMQRKELQDALHRKNARKDLEKIKTQRWNWAAKWGEEVLSCLGLILGTQRVAGSNSSKYESSGFLNSDQMSDLRGTSQLSRWAPSRSSRFQGRNQTTRRGWAWSWQPPGFFRVTPPAVRESEVELEAAPNKLPVSFSVASCCQFSHGIQPSKNDICRARDEEKRVHHNRAHDEGFKGRTRYLPALRLFRSVLRKSRSWLRRFVSR